MWFGRGVTPEPTQQGPDVSSSPSPETIVSEPSAAPAQPAPPAGPEPLPLATPPEPVRITSSVEPGIPVGRGSSSPPRPAAVPLPPGVRGSSARPEPQAEAKADLENVQYMLRDFRARLGENPVGSNADIMRAVMGGNPAKATLGPPPGQALNEKGELTDRWGTAYFFHQLSKESMEIRSAGPDRTMYTGDDLVTR